jgi:hypothetical protein
MTLDERIEALVQSVELLLAESREHSKQLEQDGEHIRALARIAEIHERRLSALECGEPE